MKKILALLLAVMLFVGVIFIGVNAEEVADANVEQGNTDCTCGGSYGDWSYPTSGTCVGGRYERFCGNCGSKQTAKDITPKTISFTVPAIGANVGDIVMLSLYDVYFTSSKVVPAKDIVWSSEDIEIVNGQICPTKAGTYKLTATSGTSTKSVYLVVKNPTDTEYVLFFDDFGRDTNGDGKFDATDTDVINIPTKGNAAQGDYEIIQQPNGTSAYIQNGKLVLDTLGNASNQMRVLLPKWIGDFGDYKIDTSFTIVSTVGNDTSRWFATMARVKNDSDYFPIWQAAVRKAAKSHSSGVEISYTGNGVNWEVPCKNRYTEDIDSSKYYTQTLNVVGTEAYHYINGTFIQSTQNASKHLGTGVGLVGFHLRATLVSVDSIKIAVPIDDSIHNFGDWTTKKAATCTVDGTEIRTCKNCDATEERVIKAEHKGFGNWNVITPATCTTKGTQQRVCADCGKVESSTINATGHSLVKQVVKAPSCTESGYREYNICTNCDYTTFSGEFGPFGHYFDREIKSIAHRGYSNTAPENTLPAYILAKEKGFSFVECDIAFTKDGIAVLLHDATIDRTSNGSGNISELTYEELLKYDFGSWKNSKYKGTKIPTFEEFITLCKELGLHPYIEIKNDATYTQEQVKSLVDIVEKYGMEDSCSWISFNITYLEYVKNVDDTARLGFVSSKNVTQSLINPVLALQTGKNEVFLDISYNMLNENNAMLVIANGLALETWTVDNTNDIKQRPKYISGYTSNKLIATNTLVKSAVTAPTCGAQGYTTYTCLCGETKVDNYVPATEKHTYENGVCTGCGKALYCADPTHNLKIISISYANGYNMVGVKVVKCLDCKTIETETEAQALFTCLGYSAPENGFGAFAIGYLANKSAIFDYETITNKTVNYGVFASLQSNIGNKDIFASNGTPLLGVVCVDVTKYENNAFELKIAGITDEQKSAKLAMGAYVAVTNEEATECSYIQAELPNGNDKYSFVSYNDIVKPKQN